MTAFACKGEGSVTIDRRKVLAGLTGLAASTALPAWAQFGNAIPPQNDPWAQVDPYADPRNGHPSRPAAASPSVSKPSNEAFRSKRAPLTEEEKEEVAIGRVLHKKWVEESGGPHPNPRLQQAIRDFCAPLFAIADRANLPWHVTLVGNRSVNASAGPGGGVIVHTGLFSIYDHPGQLASTIGHEIGHVDKNHVNNNSVRELIVFARKNQMFVPGSEAIPTLIPGAKGVDFFTLSELAYSRDDEAEADSHGVEILSRLGVDPVQAVRDYKAFMLHGRLSGSSNNEWLRSHPLDEDRLQAVSNLVALRPRPKNEYAFAGWDALHAAFPTASQFRGI
jgi:predicted Zn-dependent protease